MRKDEIVKNICEQLKIEGYIVDHEYDHFNGPDAIPLPVAVYRRVTPGNFSADGMVYKRGNNVDLEIYAADPDEMAELMAAVEEKLDEAELYYRITADTAYIESEQFYETLYEL